MIVRMGKVGQKKQGPRGIAPWRPLSRQHAADGLNSFVPHQRFDISCETPKIAHQDQQGGVIHMMI
jgi:hypothetical protein